jgi:hypothetical protein
MQRAICYLRAKQQTDTLVAIPTNKHDEAPFY